MIENLGLVIRVLRAQRGMTQAALADKAGLSHSYISILENNKEDRSPTIGSLKNIAYALELPLWRMIKMAEEGFEVV